MKVRDETMRKRSRMDRVTCGTGAVQSERDALAIKDAQLGLAGRSTVVVYSRGFPSWQSPWNHVD